MYQNLLRSMIGSDNELNIIEIGANDGKISDPIYEFIREHPDRTRVLLVEPQSDVLPYLRENYSFHDCFEIVNKAVSNGSRELTLWRVRREYWNKIPRYDWVPFYRRPTGVTTANRDILVEWVEDNVRTRDTPDQVISPMMVETIEASELMEQSSLFNRDEIDLLQVDAEGMEDQIVQHFFDHGIYPRVINVEDKHIPSERLLTYIALLSINNYKVYNWNEHERLAVRRNNRNE